MVFSGLDLAVLLSYLGVIAAIGFWCSRRNRDWDDFMFGGRQMPWFPVGISLIATSVSASTFLGNPADTFANDMTYLMLSFGGFTAVIIIAFVFIPRFQRLRLSSAYEILELRFSRRVRLLAAILYTCHIVLRTGVLLYGPALVLANVFHLNIYLSICIMSLLAVGYTVLGGFRAVVWTDVLQFFVLMGGGLLTIWFCVRGIGSLSELVRLAGEAGKTHWLDFSPDPSSARNFLSAAVVYTVFELAIRGCDQQFVQRYLSCKNVAEANRSSVLSVVFGLMVAVVFFWVGAALFVYFNVSRVRVLPGELGVNDVFPYFIAHELPPGLTGLMVAAIFAAAMSSLDSAITALSNTTVTDFLSGSRKQDPSSQLGRARFWVIVWGVAGTIAALFCVLGRQSLLQKALFFTSLFTGPLLGLFLFAFFRPATQPKALFYGAITGMLSLLLFSRIPLIPEGWWQPLYSFSWPWNPLISLAGTTIATLLLDGWMKAKAGVRAGANPPEKS